MAAVLSLNVLGNLEEEIELSPGHKSLLLNSQVKTDKEDFKSGLAATLTYLTAVKLLEAKYPHLKCN